MNALLQLDGVAWWHVAGWTMLHYLWMGAVVGVAALVSRVVLRRASANVRYAAALACLAVLAVLPVGIGIGVGQRIGVSAPMSGVSETGEDIASNDQPVANSTRPSAPAGHQIAKTAGGIVELKRESRPVETGLVDGLAPLEVTNPDSNPRPTTFIKQRGLTAEYGWQTVVDYCAVYLPWVWIVGAPLTFLLLTTGVVGAERLRRQSRVLRDGPVAEAAARIAESLQIGRRVTIAVCERIAAPVLVGIVRPLILLPPAALTGWSPDEIEMVLLHELAHVRRWDNLVNLVQRMVEAVLFFQPAVWLVSNWVRREREACCDAVVVGRTNRPHAYAELLVALASQLPRSVLFHPAASSAMAAGPLRGRIRRILGIEDDPLLISGKSLGVVMSGLLLAATLVVLGVTTNTQAKEEGFTSESTEGTENKPEVSFVVGTTRFEKGDSIAITKIRGTSAIFEPGNTYWIEGTYTLASRERATLAANVTAVRPAEGWSSGDGLQQTSIERGRGKFNLRFLMTYPGRPHVSFYPADGGQSFGGVYFGTADSARKQQQEERLALTGVDPMEIAEKRAATQNNLKDLAIALLNYESATKNFPPRAKFDADGKPLLSWRVLVLPYLSRAYLNPDSEEAKLCAEFHFDEPWDSDHNRQLIARMPAVFKNPRIDKPGMTNYLAVVGRECLFDDAGRPVRMRDVTDGTSNTIAIVEADADRAVEWTKPEDWEFDREHPTAGLGGMWPGRWYAAWVDGHISHVSSKEQPDHVGIQFTRAGGETDSLAVSAGRGSEMVATDDGMHRGMVGEMGMGDAGELTTENAEGTEKREGKSRQEDTARLRQLFKIDGANPKQTEHYSLRPEQRDAVEGLIDGLTRDAYGPQMEIEHRWLDGNSRIEIVAPQRAHREFFAKVFNKLSEEAAVESDKWPAGIGFPSPEEGEISRRAWQKLGLKLVPATDEEREKAGTSQGVKVVGGIPREAVPGEPELLILVGLNGVPFNSFSDVAKALDELERKPNPILTCMMASDGKGVVFQKVLGADLSKMRQVSIGERDPQAEIRQLEITEGLRAKRELEVQLNELQSDYRSIEGPPKSPAARSEKESAMRKEHLIRVGILQQQIAGLNESLRKNTEALHHASGLSNKLQETSDGSKVASEGAASKFPSLEEQKLADVAWDMLGLELENINKEELRRVENQGYEGGLRIAAARQATRNAYHAPFKFGEGDILVGLHVWPTRSLQDVAAVLERDDIAELNPLKYYVVSLGTESDEFEAATGDRVVSGRIAVTLPEPKPRRSNSSASNSETSRLPRVVAAAPTPIPLGAAEYPIVPSVDVDLEATLAADPNLAMLNQKLMGLQYELSSLKSKSRNSDSKESDRLKRMIAAAQRQISQYQENVRLQLNPSRRPNADKLRVPTIPNAVTGGRNDQAAPIVGGMTPEGLVYEAAPPEGLGPQEPSLPPPATLTPAPYRPGIEPVDVTALPIPKDVKQALRERGPLTVALFYGENSAPCQEMISMLQEFERTHLSLPVAFDAKSVEMNRQAAIRYGIERVPTLIWLRDDEELNRSVGAISLAEFGNQLCAVARALSERKTAPPKLLYDGKTFDQWRSAWKTELSTEKRLEAVKALAAFGANGNGKEAAEAILDVANQLSWNTLDDSSAGRLKQACVDAFMTGQSTGGYQIPTAEWLPLLVERMGASAKVKSFAGYVFYSIQQGDTSFLQPLLEYSRQDDMRDLALFGLKRVDPKLENKDVLQRFQEALHEKNQTAEQRVQLIASFCYPEYPQDGRPPYVAVRYIPKLELLLLDPTENTRRAARNAVAGIDAENARGLVKHLETYLEDESRKDRQEVIRAVAAIGPHALPLSDKLEKIALSENDPNRYSAAVALERIRKNSDEAYQNLGINPQTTVFAPFERQLDAERRELFPDGNYPPSDQMLGGGGGFF